MEIPERSFLDPRCRSYARQPAPSGCGQAPIRSPLIDAPYLPRNTFLDEGILRTWSQKRLSKREKPLTESSRLVRRKNITMWFPRYCKGLAQSSRLYPTPQKIPLDSHGTIPPANGVPSSAEKVF
jgi:hypothetical protein